VDLALRAETQLLTDDVVIAGALEDAAVFLRVEARVHDRDDATELPAVEVLFHLLHEVLIGGIARPHPAAHRDPAAGDREADHSLGKLRTLIPAVPPFAKALGVLGVGIFTLDLKVNGGGVDEDQVDLKIEEVGDREKDFTLDLVLGLKQEVHRPVELVHLDFGKSIDPYLVPDPLLHRQLARRCQRSVGDHGKDQAFDRCGEAALVEKVSQRTVNAEFTPKRVEEVGAAELSRTEVLERPVQVELFLKRLDLTGLKEATDAHHKTTKGIDVKLILAAKAVENLGFRRLGHRIA